MHRREKVLFFTGGMSLLTHGILFSALYFFNKNLPFSLAVGLYGLGAICLFLYIQHSLVLRFFAAIAFWILNIGIGFGLLLLTMVLPGSKEHNYVMYEVCLPAMRTYYNVGEDALFPVSEVDKEGNGKWWYQHLECEQNVYSGRGPIFSENPPGFIPIER